jgi:ribonuclease BN (tRNA processing enzyme)
MDPNGGHSTIYGAIESATKAGVGALVLCHLSTRYSVEDAAKEAIRAAGEMGYRGAIKLLDGHRTVDVRGAS